MQTNYCKTSQTSLKRISWSGSRSILQCSITLFGSWNLFFSQNLPPVKIDCSILTNRVLTNTIGLATDAWSLALETCIIIINTQTWAALWQNQHCGCAPSEDADQPGHPPSLIRVFALHPLGSWGPKVCSCGQRRLWSDWANTQADLSLCWAHMPFRWFCHATAHLYLKKIKHESLCMSECVWTIFLRVENQDRSVSF